MQAKKGSPNCFPNWQDVLDDRRGLYKVCRRLEPNAAIDAFATAIDAFANR